MDSDLSTALTAFDSNSFAILERNRRRALKAVGLQVGRLVGRHKCPEDVGQHVGRHMTDHMGPHPARKARALTMVRAGVAVSRVNGTRHLYIVPSDGGLRHYLVNSGGPPLFTESCTCPDFSKRLAPCKHIELVRLDIAAERGELPPVVADTKTLPSRDWSAYNLAQLEEGRLVHLLLRDLANGFPEPERDPRRAGRKPVPLRDQVFCAVLRSYHGFSLRRSHQFREAATRLGLLSSPHSYTLVSHFLCRDDVTEGLHQMLAQSALPLAVIEDRCAVDSTGLRTTRFNSYRKEKYEPCRVNEWLKLHSLVLVRSHGIPALEVTAGTANDAPWLPVLLSRAKAAGFDLKVALADRSYQGRPNYRATTELEVELLVPFKRNQTGEAKGVASYHKAFLEFMYHRERFDALYSQRAQAESAFSNFKLKLTETLASKSFDSQSNEVLCLAIAHNLMTVVRHMFLIGIEPDFLRSGPSPYASGPGG